MLFTTNDAYGTRIEEWFFVHKGHVVSCLDNDALIGHVTDVV